MEIHRQAEQLQAGELPFAQGKQEVGRQAVAASLDRFVGLTPVCEELGIPRSSVYAHRAREAEPRVSEGRGPKAQVEHRTFKLPLVQQAFDLVGGQPQLLGSLPNRKNLEVSSSADGLLNGGTPAKVRFRRQLLQSLCVDGAATTIPRERGIAIAWKLSLP